MISVPIAVNNAFFQWQLELWWWNQKRVYGSDARARSLAVVVDKNFTGDKPYPDDWLKDIPHVRVTGIWSRPVSDQPTVSGDLPLNIQQGLMQLLPTLADDEIIEVLDCDMFHLRPAPDAVVRNDMLVVCDLYENWHLKSITDHKRIIEPYFRNKGRFYNGGFVPIVGKVGTFRKLMYEWDAVHRDILLKQKDRNIRWWAGMFALQATCEKNKVTMVADDSCYIPGHNTLKDSHYAVHYSVDRHFAKRSFPDIDIAALPDNLFYDRVKAWYAQSGFAAALSV